MKKKTGRRMISLLMALILAIGTLQVPGLTLKAHAEPMPLNPNGTVNYEMDLYGKITISGTGEWKYAIGDFSDKDNIKEVVIEQGVTNMPVNALSECTKLTSVSIPSSVKTIGECAFYGCSSLTTVTFASGVENIGYLAFCGCTALTGIDLPDSLISLGNSVFSGCEKLESINIPKNVTSVGERIFSDCGSLGSISVAAENTEYSSSNGVFFNYDKSLLIKYPHAKAGATYTIPDSVTEIGLQAFYDNGQLTSVVIPGSVTKIGDEAFYKCNGLTNVTIPGSVERIESYAFWGCQALAGVVMEEGVKEIGPSAFMSCVKLANVTIPKSVTTIEASAFSYADALTITYLGTETEWNSINKYADELWDTVTILFDGAFIVESGACGTDAQYELDNKGVLTLKGTGAVTDDPWNDSHSGDVKVLMIESGITDVAGAELINSYNLESASVEPENTEYIAEDGVLFNKDKTLLILYPCKKSGSAYSVPGSVKDIGDYAFTRCSSLTGITIPEGVTSIGEGVFFKCNGLKNISLPDSVTSLGAGAFGACTSLEEMTIPDNVTEIKNDTFGNCSALTEITFSDKVTSIGKDAFLNCNAPEDVYYGGAQTKWDAISIDTSNAYLLNNAKIHFMKGSCGTDATWTLTKDGVLTISGTGNIGVVAGDTWKPADVKEVVIESGVKEIGMMTFAGCTSLKNVSLPRGLEKIENDAFDSCTGITDVYFGGTEAEWNNITIAGGNEALEGKVHFTVFVTGVSIAPETLSLEIGKSGTLTATVAPENAANKKISWTSSNTSVATVADGVVTALAEGETTITVTTEDGGKTASCKVTVVKTPEAEEPDDKPAEPEETEGPLGPVKPDLSRYIASGNEIAVKSINLKKTIFKDVKGIKKFNVTAGDETAVKIKGSTLTVLKDATVTIEAVNKKKEKLAEKTITLIAPRIDTAPATEIYRRGTLDLNKYILSTVQPSAWKSSNKKVATVSENGLLLMKKSGTVKITVTFPAEKGMSAKKLTIKLKIRMPQFKKTTYTVKTGKTVKTAVKNAESSEITYRIEDPSIATVDASGKVTGVSKGTTKLIMRVRDIDYETKIKVK